MPSNITHNPTQWVTNAWWVILLLITVTIGAVYQQTLAFGIPILILVTWFTLKDYRWIYYSMLILIPFSTEVYLPNGLGTDFPSEPFMWLNTGIVALLLIGKKWNIEVLKKFDNWIVIFLILHLFWTFLTSLNSTIPIRSIKFFIAKIWYVVPFFFFSIYFIKSDKQLKTIWRITLVASIVVMIYAFLNHALHGFTFKSSNKVLKPFFRNHVTYAGLVALLTPFFVAYTRIYWKKWWITIAGLLFFIICTYFSYTRAAMLSLVIGFGAMLIIHFGHVAKTLVLAVVIAILGVFYVSIDNKYLDYAPNFERTIVHEKFDNLIEATYKLEDISTMERLYRWVAGFEMLKEKPIVGFGPNTFYNNYSQYSVSAFQTYVSDNPEMSGVHNYYLMVAIDQGIIGLILFMGFVFATLIIGQKIYHNSTDLRDKYMIMAALTSQVIILSMNLINDLIETDKIGAYFFLNAAIIVFYYNKDKSDKIKTN